jgi:hypothetical protein
MTWKHDELAADLACHLRGPERMVWTDMQLGPAGSPRPDVFTIERSYSKPRPAAYEVKISRSDFRSDTTKGKWQSYLAFAGSVTFAVPDGLITLAEVPDGCGLIVRKDQVWRYARRPTVQRVEIGAHAWMKLLLDGRSREFAPAQPRSRSVDLWKDDERIRKKFGDAVARAARDLASVQAQATRLQAYARDAMQRADKDAQMHRKYVIERAEKEVPLLTELRDQLADWLGIEGTATGFAIQHKIAEMRRTVDTDARVRAAEDRVNRAHSALTNALSFLTMPQPVAPPGASA